MRTAMNKVKLRDTAIQVIDGDRGANYPKKSDFYRSGYCVFLDASNVTKDGFNLDTPVFITKNKSDSLRGGKLSRKDIVLTTRGTIGNFAYFNESVNYDHIRINSGMLILRSSDEFESAYLYYLLRSRLIGEQIKTKTTGSSQPQITVGIVKDLTLLQPERLVQQRVARVITTMDQKIALNRQINAKLEALAQDLYNYWFVQFNFPDTNNRPLLYHTFSWLRLGAQYA